jgi:hypothetical protein
MRILLVSLLLISTFYIAYTIEQKYYWTENMTEKDRQRVFNEAIYDLSANKQNRSFDSYTSTPTYTSLGNYSVSVMESGSQGSLIFRFGSNLYKVTATKIN